MRLEAEYLDGPIPFLQYEYVDGVDFAKLLEERFERGGPLVPDHAAAIVLKLADILSIAHARPTSIVHRDIKPQNILVANHRVLRIFEELGVEGDLRLAELKVMDFGIGARSRLGAPGASASQSIGVFFDGFRTGAYASSQQNAGHPARESDDVFALVVIWIAMLAHRGEWAA